MKIRTLVLTHSFAPVFVVGALLFSACSTTKNDVTGNDTPRAAQGDHGAMPPQFEADMKAYMAAGQPGPMHQFLAKGAGTWKGTSTMWMSPDMPPTVSESTCTTTTEMDGRFTKCEYAGDMPGMGPFHGLGFSGFDNVSQKFVQTWMDTCSTGIMVGEGTLGADGKTLTWSFRGNCPITKGPVTMRQIERHTSDDAMSLEMYGNDPHSGKEYKMMQIEMKRQSHGKVGS